MLDELTNSIYLSFSELAWLVLMFMFVGFANYQTNYQKELTDLQSDLDVRNRKLETTQYDLQKAQEEANIEEKERCELENQNSKLRFQAQESIKKLDECTQKLVECQNKKNDKENDLSKNRKIEESNASEIKSLIIDNAILSEELVKFKSEIKNLHRKTQDQVTIPNDAIISKELIGLKGDLSRVVFIFDCSGSMLESGRWEQAKNTVTTWLKYLPFKECKVIAFNDTFQCFPQNEGEFLNLNTSDTIPKRTELLDWLEGQKPQGLTNTFQALQKAFSYDSVTCIILFTDGQPELNAISNVIKKTVKVVKESFMKLFNDDKQPNRIEETYEGGVNNQELKESIYALLSMEKKKAQNNGRPPIPVNTVGLGDYFNNDFGKFLLKVANDTGGSFVGL